jgi:rubrerythrin
MERYYKASDVHDVISALAHEPYYKHEYESFYEGVCAVEGELQCLEQFEINEQRLGRWLGEDPSEWECSLCHYEVERWNNTPYCPGCGAKMEVKK